MNDKRQVVENICLLGHLNHKGVFEHVIETHISRLRSTPNHSLAFYRVHDRG